MLLLFEKFLAFLRRDLLIASRYRGAFVTWPLSIVAELASVYYLARAIGAGFRPDGFEYFPFLLVGTAIVQVIVVSMEAFVESVRDCPSMSTSAPGGTSRSLSGAPVSPGTSHTPQRTVLTAQSPQCECFDAPRLRGTHLVQRRHRVDKPDVVAQVAFV